MLAVWLAIDMIFRTVNANESIIDYTLGYGAECVSNEYNWLYRNYLFTHTVCTFIQLIELRDENSSYDENKTSNFVKVCGVMTIPVYMGFILYNTEANYSLDEKCTVHAWQSLEEFIFYSSVFTTCILTAIAMISPESITHSTTVSKRMFK